MAVAGIVAAGRAEPAGGEGTAALLATQTTCAGQVRYISSMSAEYVETHLADVEVVALRVELRVEVVEDGRVEAVGLRDVVAGVAELDDVRGAAVLALVAEAERLARLEVVALRVDGRVHDRKLVAGGAMRQYPRIELSAELGTTDSAQGRGTTIFATSKDGGVYGLVHGFMYNCGGTQDV